MANKQLAYLCIIILLLDISCSVSATSIRKQSNKKRLTNIGGEKSLLQSSRVARGLVAADDKVYFLFKARNGHLPRNRGQLPHASLSQNSDAFLVSIPNRPPPPPPRTPPELISTQIDTIVFDALHHQMLVKVPNRPPPPPPQTPPPPPSSVSMMLVQVPNRPPPPPPQTPPPPPSSVSMMLVSVPNRPPPPPPQTPPPPPSSVSMVLVKVPNRPPPPPPQTPPPPPSSVSMMLVSVPNRPPPPPPQTPPPPPTPTSSGPIPPPPLMLVQQQQENITQEFLNCMNSHCGNEVHECLKDKGCNNAWNCGLACPANDMTCAKECVTENWDPALSSVADCAAKFCLAPPPQI